MPNLSVISWLKQTITSWLHISKEPIQERWWPEIQQKRLQDLIARTQTGALIYLFITIIVAGVVLTNDPNLQKSLWVAGCSLPSLLIAAIRFILLKTYARILVYNLRWGFFFVDLGVGAGALAWSLIFCAAILDTPLQQNLHFLLIALLCFCSGALINVSIHKRTVVVLLICTWALPVSALLSGQSILDYKLSWVLCIYGVAMYYIAQIPRNEYESAVHSKLILTHKMSELERISNHDALTGIYNRRYFDERIVEEMGRAQRLGYALSVLSIDIDYFKQINDTYGHAVGDQCLRLAASIIDEHFSRKEDCVARVGGEEFSIILPGLDERRGLLLANELRLKFIGATYVSDFQSISFTVSIGGATYSGSKEITAERLLWMADRALYFSKDSGRNRASWMPYYHGQCYSMDNQNETSQSIL